MKSKAIIDYEEVLPEPPRAKDKMTSCVLLPT